jgi:hypothetical protein
MVNALPTVHGSIGDGETERVGKFFSFCAAFASVLAIFMFNEVSLYCIDMIEHEVSGE